MAADPLTQIIHGFTLDCNDPACDICNLGPLPDEDRVDWLARLSAQFAANPLSDRPLPPGAEPITPVIPMAPCGVCERVKPVNAPCDSCLKQNRGRAVGAATLPDGRLICRRCGSERVPNTRCGICAANLKSRRATA